jgi:hypothetical protein
VTARTLDYKEYLASRDWAVLKRAVRKRSKSICERCFRAPAEQVHHLNYRRVGHEELADLQHVCKPCHEYLSAVTDFDPRLVCCTPEEAWTLAQEIRDDVPELYEAAVQHWREVKANAQ